MLNLMNGRFSMAHKHNINGTNEYTIYSEHHEISDKYFAISLINITICLVPLQNLLTH